MSSMSLYRKRSSFSSSKTMTKYPSYEQVTSSLTREITLNRLHDSPNLESYRRDLSAENKNPSDFSKRNCVVSIFSESVMFCLIFQGARSTAFDASIVEDGAKKVTEKLLWFGTGRRSFSYSDVYIIPVVLARQKELRVSEVVYEARSTVPSLLIMCFA